MKIEVSTGHRICFFRLFWVIFAHLFELLLQLCTDLAIIAQECVEELYEKT